MTAAIDETHDPERTSWAESANGHPDFPIQNLPFGIFSGQGFGRRAGVAIGDEVLDLAAAAAWLPDAVVAAVAAPTLNALFALPSVERLALRRALTILLSDKRRAVALRPILRHRTDCTMHVPCAIGDYTDFYVGIHHARNVGKQFRPDMPLLPNYKWVPIGYHGRASSVRASDVPIIRPNGQRKLPDVDDPVFGPTARLDYELELGFWIGAGNPLGSPIALRDAPEHVAGFCLLNDWSARDLQAWEYQPLGPFLSKNFHTTVSPWVVTAEAMAPFRSAQAVRPAGDPKPLPNLWDATDQASGGLSLELEVTLSSVSMREQDLAPIILSRGPASNMYWTVGQLIAHHTSNGCDLNPGDLLGSGTISGPARDAAGSLIEITVGGRQPIDLPTGEQRSFLEDGDELTLLAQARAPGFVSIGFGPCRVQVKSGPVYQVSGKENTTQPTA